MRRTALLFVALFALSGCYTTKYVYGKESRGNETYSAWQHTFFWGLISPGEVNLSNYCGDAGIYKLKSQVGGIALLANWLTAGIWIPVHVRVVCAAK